MYLLRTGDEKEARDVARARRGRSTRAIAITKNLLDLLDKLDKFEVVTDGPIIFKFDKKEAAVLQAVRAAARRARPTKTFQKRYGFTPQGPILVEVFPLHDDFAVRTLGLPGIDGALGACFGRVVSMDSPAARPPGEIQLAGDAVARAGARLHAAAVEVPRAALADRGHFGLRGAPPQPGVGPRADARVRAPSSAKGKTFGVKRLPEAFKHPENLSLAYFEASLVVEHLVELNGDAGLRTLLLAYADGAQDADAFTKAFGKNVDDVDASFKAFVEQHYGTLRDAMGDPPREGRRRTTSPACARAPRRRRATSSAS